MDVDKFLRKDDTLIIKGAAIILMLMHHLWFFPERLVGGKLKFLFEESLMLGSFGKICISIFFFLSGYGLYQKNNGKKFDLIDRLKKLYISYWKVFLIFIPAALLFFKNQNAYCEDTMIYSIFSSVNVNEIIKCFLGLSDCLNYEWWVFRSFVIAYITFPLIRKIADKYSLTIDLLLVIIFSILMSNVFSYIGQMEEFGYLTYNLLYKWFFCQSEPFIACYWIGIVAASKGLLDRINDDLKKENLLNPVFDVAFIFVIIYLRERVLYANFDIFFVPVLIVIIIDFVNKITFLSKPLVCFGKQSMNMWLIHSFLCYYFYPIAKLVTSLKWAVPSLLILIVLSYTCSLLVDYIWKLIDLLFTRAGVNK